MGKNKIEQIITCVVIGFSALFGFANGFLLMVMYTFHDNYEYYQFVRVSAYTSLLLFTISSGNGIKLLYLHRRNKKFLLRFILFLGISFVVSYMVIGFVYSQIGII